MKKIENELDIITEITGIKDKIIIDVGCGTGELVRKLTEEGARVIGIDRPDMLVKTKNNQKLLQGVEKREAEKMGRWEEGKKIEAGNPGSREAEKTDDILRRQEDDRQAQLRNPLIMVPRPHAETNENQHHRFAQHIDSPRRGAPGRRRQGIFIAGLGENLPFKNNYADIIIFFASFHHVPGAMMKQTLQETQRVLKAGGIGIFLEPVGRDGSYFEIIRLVEDERDIQRLAFESIKKAHTFGLGNKREEIKYFERSFDDYVNLLKVFVEDEAERNGYLKEAGKITERLSHEAGIPIEDYRYKSICRVNVLHKSS